MKIVSDKDLFITTLGGTAVRFEAGVPREIADEIGLLAIQMGAKEHNDKVVEEKPTNPGLEAAPQGAEEHVGVANDQDIILCLEKMMDEGDPKNFRADGYPKAAAVNKALGRTIDADAREAAWESILNS